MAVKSAFAVLALLAATPALAQSADPPADQGEIVGTWSSLIPQRSQVQDAFDLLDPCGTTDQTCTPTRTYDVLAASCTRIGIEMGRLAVACRVDIAMTDTLPEQKVTRYRDQCAHLFMLPDGNWKLFHPRERACEMSSILTRDPHPWPERKDMERSAVGAFQCYDGEASDCFNYSKSAVVSSWRCHGQPPGPEGEPRFVCQINGVVSFTSRKPQPFRNVCVRVKRYSVLGESPPYWGTDYEEGYPECEADWRARR